MNIGSKCVHVGCSSKELTWKSAWLDMAPRPSVSNVIWILSSDTICQLNQLFLNSEAAMLSRRGIIIAKGSRTQLLQHSGRGSGLDFQTESNRVGAVTPSALCRAWSALCRRTLQSSICTTCTSAGGQKCTKQKKQQQNCQVALFWKQHKQQWHCQVNQTSQSCPSNLICLCRRKPSEDKDKEKRTIHSFTAILFAPMLHHNVRFNIYLSFYLYCSCLIFPIAVH